MISAAITAVVFVGVSFLRNSKRLGSFKKGFAFQKLTGAQKLTTAAEKLGKTVKISHYVGKEIAKTLVRTGLSELASVGINKSLDALSNKYEHELLNSIKKSVNEKWAKVESEAKELYRVCEASMDSKLLIEDCISRKIQNISEMAEFRNFVGMCGPVMQGLGKAFAGSKGLLFKQVYRIK